MIKALVSDTKTREPDCLELNGTLRDIEYDTCLLIGRIYWALHDQRSAAAALYRDMIEQMLTDPDCPIWQEDFREADRGGDVTACQYTVRTEADDDRS